MSFLWCLFVLVDTSFGLLASGKMKMNTTRYVSPTHQTFPCVCGRRSNPRPGVVEEVTLQDIDILGAIGDSYTAAFAANSGGLDYFTEYWGTSFVTGEFLGRFINISGRFNL